MRTAGGARRPLSAQTFPTAGPAEPAAAQARSASAARSRGRQLPGARICGSSSARPYFSRPPRTQMYKSRQALESRLVETLHVQQRVLRMHQFRKRRDVMKALLGQECAANHLALLLDRDPHPPEVAAP